MSAAAKPDLFSSVVLLREAQPHEVEVLLIRRSDQAVTRGGMHGFPRGPVQKSDHEEAIVRRCRGLSGEGARKILGAHFSPSRALGFWIAAGRVLFEEVGVLLAVKENGEPIALDVELNGRLRAKRAALGERRLGFRAILEGENLFCDAGSIRYFSHWRGKSPDGDTRVFLAALPERLRTLAAPDEDMQWLAPDRALQLFNRGEMPMAFATFASLRTLADFGSLESVLKEFQPEFT